MTNTPQLTFKQAILLRAFLMEPEDLEPPDPRLLDARGNVSPTKARAALEAYDREWVTVRRADVEEVMGLLGLHFTFPEGTSGARLMSALEAK